MCVISTIISVPVQRIPTLHDEPRNVTCSCSSPNRRRCWEITAQVYFFPLFPLFVSPKLKRNTQQRNFLFFPSHINRICQVMRDDQDTSNVIPKSLNIKMDLIFHRIRVCLQIWGFSGQNICHHFNFLSLTGAESFLSIFFFFFLRESLKILVKMMVFSFSFSSVGKIQAEECQCLES